MRVTPPLRLARVGNLGQHGSQASLGNRRQHCVSPLQTQKIKLPPWKPCICYASTPDPVSASTDQFLGTLSTNSDAASRTEEPWLQAYHWRFQDCILTSDASKCRSPANHGEFLKVTRRHAV